MNRSKVKILGKKEKRKSIKSQYVKNLVRKYFYNHGKRIDVMDGVHKLKHLGARETRNINSNNKLPVSGKNLLCFPENKTWHWVEIVPFEINILRNLWALPREAVLKLYWNCFPEFHIHFKWFTLKRIAMHFLITSFHEIASAFYSGMLLFWSM